MWFEDKPDITVFGRFHKKKDVVLKNNFSLPFKIALTSFLIAGIGIIATGFIFYRDGDAMLHRQALSRLNDDLRRENVRLEMAYQTFREDALFLTHSAEVRGVVRAKTGDGYDDLENTTEAVWRERLANLFRTVLQERSAYQSIRLICADDTGREYVRVDKLSGSIDEIRGDQLQDKGHRDYFQQIVRLNQGEVYLSPINLNREQGRITLPAQPMLRIGTPVDAGSGKRIGIIVINVDFAEISYSFIHQENTITYFIANNRGDYLAHPNPELPFAFEFNIQHRIQDSYPLNEFLLSSATMKDTAFDLPENRGGLAARKFFFDPLHKDRFIVLSALASYELMKKESNQFRQKLTALLTVFAICLSVVTAFLARVLTRPIKELTLVADKIAMGEQDVTIPIRSNDEVGRLALSMKMMLGRLFDSREELRQLANSLEEKVAERTADLAQINDELQNEISERLQVEESLRITSKFFENSHEALVITDAEANIIDCNETFLTMNGYTQSECIGANCSMQKSDRHDSAFYRQLWDQLETEGSWQGEIWNRRKDGGVYPQWLSISAVYNDEQEVTHYVGIATDITARKEDEQKMEQLAHYDQLTQLPNRLLFHDRLQHAIHQAERLKHSVGVMMLDLDGFKKVNDTLGHSVGDELLILVAQRLKSEVRKVDTVARMGGDEFVAIFEDTIDAENITLIAAKIVKSLADVFRIGDKEISVSSSIGIALYPKDGEQVDVLLKHADIAMYHVKGSGKNNFKYFSPDFLDDDIVVPER